MTKCDNCGGAGHAKASCPSSGGGKYVEPERKGKGKDPKGKGKGGKSQYFQGKGSGMASVEGEWTPAQWEQFQNEQFSPNAQAQAVGQQMYGQQPNVPPPPWMQLQQGQTTSQQPWMGMGTQMNAPSMASTASPPASLASMGQFRSMYSFGEGEEE